MAIAFAMTISPPLAAQYAAALSPPRMPQPELVWMIEPLPCSIIDGSANFDIRKAPLRLDSIVSSHSSSVHSGIVFGWKTPALLNNTSILPKVRGYYALRQSSLLRTSARTKRALPPLSVISLTTCSPRSVLRPVIAPLRPRLRIVLQSRCQCPMFHQ